MEDIFKVGDRVFHLQNGWGTVLYSPKDMYYLVRFDDNGTDFWYTKTNNKVLSFTEYTLNGFSQERPEELPKKGQIVWVRGEFPSEWTIGHFFDKIDNEYCVCLSPNCGGGTHSGVEIRTTNPYEDESN